MPGLCDEVCLVPGGGLASLACMACKATNTNKFQANVANNAVEEEAEAEAAGPVAALVRPNKTTASILLQILNIVLLIVALYLSFKCNKGFNFGSVIVAACCSPCYIAYRLALPC